MSHIMCVCPRVCLFGGSCGRGKWVAYRVSKYVEPTNDNKVTILYSPYIDTTRSFLQANVCVPECAIRIQIHADPPDFRLLFPLLFTVFAFKLSYYQQNASQKMLTACQ